MLDIDWEGLIISSKLDTLKVSHLNLYLIDIIGKTLAQIRKTGYLKKDKILDILAHFYTHRGKISTPAVSSTMNLTL